MTRNSLTDTFLSMMEYIDSDPGVAGAIFHTVEEAPESSERDGLMALLLHEGIGTPVDLEKCFEYAEKAAFEGGDPCGYYVLGAMCDHCETPDQKEGGPLQKYDHYDAERFYEICADIDRWRERAEALREKEASRDPAIEED